MSYKFDFIVVGGGVIGSSIAFHLARKGVRVVVLERDTVGGQASRAAAGMLAAQEESSTPDALFEACLASREQFEQLALEVRYLSRIDPEYEVNGIWRIAESAEEKASLLDKKAWQEAKGQQAEWWETDKVLEAFPAIERDFPGALYCPKDGQVNAAKWVEALVDASRYLGVRFVEKVGSVNVIRDGGRVVGIRTETEDYEAGHVVLAAGAWTAGLLSELRLRIPFEPVKGQVIVLDGFPRGWKGPVFIGNGYFTPRADGRILVGATIERVGFDARPTLTGRQELAEWAVRQCPILQHSAIIHHWAGLRPGTADGLPVMGMVPGWEGLSVCAGHYRNGILLSPFSGRYLADGLLENKWDPRGEAFRPERFLSAKKKDSASSAAEKPPQRQAVGR